MTSTKIDDYRKPDGGIDWESYRKAETANGERCYRCGRWILFGCGYQRLCPSCEDLDRNVEEVESQDMLRCPHCQHQRRVDWEDNIGEEGDHDLFCDNCEKDFTITTRIEYHFTSPPLNKTEAKEEEPDDDID